MIYFMIAASIIVADKILKEYFKSSFQGKHREVRAEESKKSGMRWENKSKKAKINPFKKKEKLEYKKNNKGNNKETTKERECGWKAISKGNWREYLTPRIELLENRGAASGILAKYPKILKTISATMLCFCALALGKERQKGKVTMAGVGYALLLGGGLSNFLDRVKKGSVTDYVRFPKFPVKKISELVFNLSDFGIFAGVFCLLFRKK